MQHKNRGRMETTKMPILTIKVKKALIAASAYITIRRHNYLRMQRTQQNKIFSCVHASIDFASSNILLKTRVS